MDLVVDANVLFSVLIREGKTEELIFETDIHLFATEFLFEEFVKYRNPLLEKTRRTEEEFEALMSILKKKINTIPREETGEHIREAERISPDKNDAEYFALALKLKCSIWSNDKKLKEQDKVKVYSTRELLEMMK
jgi:predicted nucleic acid-binding protein